MNKAVTIEERRATSVDETSMANAFRVLAMDAVRAANSGHPGMPMGMAEVATVLFNRFITIDPAQSNWPDGDRWMGGRGAFIGMAGIGASTPAPDLSARSSIGADE